MYTEENFKLFISSIREIPFVPFADYVGIDHSRGRIEHIAFVETFYMISEEYNVSFRFMEVESIEGETFFYHDSGETKLIGFQCLRMEEYNIIHPIRLFSHELSHAIIDICGYGTTLDNITEDIILEEERMVDRLSYFVYKKYFREILPGLHHAEFRTYSSKKSKQKIKTECEKILTCV